MRTLWMIVTCVALLTASAPVVADTEEGRTASSDASRALARWTPRAERGEREAQFRLGAIYERGDGIERDLAEAHKWYVLAWKRNHAEAKKRALALRTKMSKAEFQDSRKRVRRWIDAFAPTAPDGVAGPDRGGLALKVREISRKRVDGYMQVCYEIETTGRSSDKTYRFSVYDLGMFVDRDRETVFPQGLTKMNLCLWKFRKGEWSMVSCASRDGTQKASTTLMPFPLEAKKDGARIWLQLHSRRGDLFLLQGEGFKPNEELTTVSRSNGEEIRSKMRAQPNGMFGIVLAPAAVRRQHKSSYSVIRKSGTLTIHYQWGKPALRIQ